MLESHLLTLFVAEWVPKEAHSVDCFLGDRPCVPGAIRVDLSAPDISPQHQYNIQSQHFRDRYIAGRIGGYADGH